MEFLIHAVTSRRSLMCSPLSQQRRRCRFSWRWTSLCSARDTIINFLTHTDPQLFSHTCFLKPPINNESCRQPCLSDWEKGHYRPGLHLSKRFRNLRSSQGFLLELILHWTYDDKFPWVIHVIQILPVGGGKHVKSDTSGVVSVAVKPWQQQLMTLFNHTLSMCIHCYFNLMWRSQYTQG